MRSKRKDERHSYVRRRADELAMTGNYSGWLQIELAIRAEGYEEARSILDDHYIRSELDRLCQIAQSPAEVENRKLFDDWVRDFVLPKASTLTGEFPGVTISVSPDGFSIVGSRNQLDVKRVFDSRKLSGTKRFTASDGNQYSGPFTNAPDKPFNEYLESDLRILVQVGMSAGY